VSEPNPKDTIVADPAQGIVVRSRVITMSEDDCIRHRALVDKWTKAVQPA
jgi:hypothetical protein